VSLIHPALMDFLFLATLWTGYLGWLTNLAKSYLDLPDYLQ